MVSRRAQRSSSAIAAKHHHWHDERQIAATAAVEAAAAPRASLYLTSSCFAGIAILVHRSCNDKRVPGIPAIYTQQHRAAEDKQRAFVGKRHSGNNTWPEKGEVHSVMSRCFGSSLCRGGGLRAAYVGGSDVTVFWWLALACLHFTGRVCWREPLSR